MSDREAGRSEWRRSKRCADGACVEVMQDLDGRVLIRDSQHPETVLDLTADQWSVFLTGVTQGDFD